MRSLHADGNKGELMLKTFQFAETLQSLVKRLVSLGETTT